MGASLPPEASHTESGRHPQAQNGGECKVFFPLVNKNISSLRGLASQYPDDIGIQNHPSVIYASGFETRDWYERDFGYTGWLDRRGCRTTQLHRVLSGNGALEYQSKEGSHDPLIYKISFEGEDVIFLRWYRRYESGYDASCQSKTNGVYARRPGGTSGAGSKPTGYDKFSAKLQVWEHANAGLEPRIYTYHPDQSGKYGDNLVQNTGKPVILQTDRWYCIEIMLKANDAGRRNGEIKLWFDGVLKAHYKNMRFRDTNDLKINELDITAYVGGACTAPKDQKVWDDNLVLATQYIGPMRSSEQIIIDNTDPGFATSHSQDAWQEYVRDDSVHYGVSHHYNKARGTGRDVAVWSFDIPKAGTYGVYAWWYAADWRPPDVPYTVRHSDGTTTVRMDQRTNGGQWNFLGTFYFRDVGSVTVSDNVSSGEAIVADAIRLAYLPKGTP